MHVPLPCCNRRFDSHEDANDDFPGPGEDVWCRSVNVDEKDWTEKLDWCDDPPDDPRSVQEDILVDLPQHHQPRSIPRIYESTVTPPLSIRLMLVRHTPCCVLSIPCAGGRTPREVVDRRRRAGAGAGADDVPRMVERAGRVEIGDAQKVG